jgi:crotonobetainyl-CoA:carnitine CoA-transferase CaiB-like acyl-CoA transferase
MEHPGRRESALHTDSPHETLYQRLHGITCDARAALAHDHFEKLPEIIKAQQTVMVELGEAGDCKNTGLIPLITNLMKEVCNVQREIGEKTAEIRAALKVVGNKRKITKAYGA